MLPQPSIGQLRPALKLALDRAGSVPPGRSLPGRVRSLVRSRRIPASWAVTMVQALDEDDDFRAWVAEDASEEQLGRVAWLWLVRPDGWADEVAGLIEVAAAAEERDKEIRLATERSQVLERELAGVRAELAQARAAQSSSAAELDEQRRSAARMQVERTEEMAASLAERDERLAGMQAAQAALGEERDALAGKVRDLEAELARTDGARRTQRFASAAPPAPEVSTDSVPPAKAALPTRSVSPAGAVSARARRATTRRPLRRPVHLPLGVFEDSTEAASYLMRVPGMHLVVDGYNVALTSWPGTGSGRAPAPDLSRLRRKLLDALGELAVRVQRSVTVVFDGRDEGGRVTATGPARPWLRILFSASTVEADELILEAVHELRPEVPVVVATNDREVRDGAHRLGANVISVGQLLAVLNRHTSM